MSDNLTLRCRKCANQMDYGRDIDPTVPAVVAIIETSQCDQCHDGDRIEEQWLDASGKRVEP